MEKFSILSSVHKLQERHEGLQPIFSKYIAEQELSSEDLTFLMSDLSIVLLNDVYTLEIASLFSPIILDLLSRASDVTKDDPITKHEWLCICLSKLIFYFPDVARFAKMYFERSYSFFYRFEDDSEPQAKKMKSEMIIPPTYKLLKAANMFLLFDTQSFKDLCDWSVLVGFLNDKDALVRWFAYQCLGRVGNIRNILSLLKNKFTNEEYLLCTAEEIECQMWNYAHYRPFRMTTVPDIPDLKLSAFEMSKEVINIGGIILSRNPYQTESVRIQKYVLVPSMKKCLHRLGLAVSAGEPVLLQGPVGCGKTSIIEYLAALTGRKASEELLKVQLGDHMDSKMLLGTHCCTEIPGEFVWKPGILIQAMTEGHWLLLEDIDRAPMDVVSLLVPVLQSRTVVLPGHANPIKAAAGFQLFTTQRLIKGSEGSYVEFRSHTRIIEDKFRKILMDPLSREELKTVICSKWPKMERVCDKILELYSLFSLDLNEDQNPDPNGSNEPFNLYCRHGRLVSTRDLFKFCTRISEYFDGGKKDMSESVFLNAVECFSDSIPSASTRLTAAESIGVKFNIPNSKAQHFCQKNKPSIEKLDNGVKIGRVSFDVHPDVLKVKKSQKAVFAHTRHSLALLEKIAVAVAKKEPVLLVGETGTGKTASVQFLADLTKHKLTVINMSQQSDSVDLIGGYKPVDLIFTVKPLRDRFLELCHDTDFFLASKNERFLMHIMNTFHKKKYDFCVELMMHAQKGVMEALLKKEKTAERLEKISKWKTFGDEVQTLYDKIIKAKSILVFKFIEGALVKAMKMGHWLLLDEINLAEAETLECLSGVLENNALFLYEKGSKEPVKRHSKFRIFACMNPATDIGKKDLPVGIRNRFTEFFVDEIEERQDLSILVREYLRNLTLNNSQVDDIVEFYLHLKKISSEKLSDGTGHYPHYSLRTLCRALNYASTNPCHNVPRSLYEAFCLSFLSQLDSASHPVVQTMIRNQILGKNRLSLLNQSIPEPGKGKYIPIQGYWIRSGKNEPSVSENYIFTPTVQQNLQDLARIVSASRYPVLLQGETSVGKTSLIQWLAKATGNTCVRVNNHEHTDIQEYIGTYTADSDGILHFKEGVLAEAMRNGYWIILDELNLAPTEVMEALNRVLDDNRELFIPETQDTILAKDGFMIFATQNPPGLYGGRKLLSRAFRNRFIELHFNEIPASELKTILHKRCKMSLSYSEKLVAVMSELQLRRRESGVFCGKQGYITLRDLFRWGDRYEKLKEPPGGMDWLQYLAEEGYLLLAGRVRHLEEERIICEAIEKHFKRKVDPELLFNLSEKTSLASRDILIRIYHSELSENFSNIVWTYNMRRLAVLVGKAMQYKEPVLLIGSTGCGKTTICQIYAELSGKKLHSVNCHMHSESADFLGGLRPVRDHEKRKSKLFEWVDGPLIEAMQNGDFFLADEISLADDSVLERLNSVLEPEQKILLAEKSFDDCEQYEVTAAEGFHFLATMNPGGDYGKKELSPALRNRFTEIWCPNSITSLSDISAIVEHNIAKGLKLNEFKRMKYSFGHLVTEFMNFFMNSDFGKRVTLSIRDVLTWVEFINISQKSQLKVKLSPAEAFCHGAFLAFLDGIGSGASACGSEDVVLKLKKHCLDYLIKLVGRKRVTNPELIIPEFLDEKYKKFGYEDLVIKPVSIIYFGLGPFGIECPHEELFNNLMGWKHNFQLESKTTKANVVKILRAMQLPKPILLEGSPGVGKSTLVKILARGTGHDLVRINLSEQTDISDLFGADLPVEGGEKGEFAWRDGPIIQALKNGEWILLDELNLASQSVLEGLNALLDHRNEVYIPELGKTFHLDKKASRIFCCQNPQRQGGSRKGLPRSFLNRFTQVYMKQMEIYDMEFIATSIYKTIPPRLISAMVLFNHELSLQVNTKRLFGHQGAPWEFNLRDVFRWCDCMIKNQSDSEYNIGEYVKLIYVDRMRTKIDKEKTLRLFEKVVRRYGLSGDQVIKNRSLKLNVFDKCVQLGYSFVPCEGSRHSDTSMTCITPSQLPYLESLMKCIEMNWMPILVGPSGSGKSTLVRTLAELCGKQLHILSVNSEMDTIELLGGFEQADSNRHIEFIAQDLEPLIEQAIVKCVLSGDTSEGKDKQLQEILYQQHNVRQCVYSGSSLQQDSCVKKLKSLKELIKTLESFELENSKDVLLSSSKAVDNLIKISTSKESSGGKFEWVDSILITAVKKGHWLLIDDANFCSSSVLDRLNALLEPEGVLTINEQGIVDGKLRTIAPHPDFRIILTLNPQNGDISRAMRNRGVEIYMEPVKNENIPNQDVFNLALFAQCKGFIHEKLLLHFCLLYSNLSSCQQIERPCLSDFISAASLCVQMVQKHGNPARAFKDSCLFVFAENNLNAHARQVAKSIINAEAHRVANEPFKIDYSVPITELLPTSFDYYQNPLLSMFKKQSCLFTVYFKGFIGRIVDCPPFPEDPDSRPVFICQKPACFSFVQPTCFRNDVRRLTVVMRILFESASMQCFEYLNHFILKSVETYVQNFRHSDPNIKNLFHILGSYKDVVKQITNAPLMKNLIETVKYIFKETNFNCMESSEAPFDLRWNSDLYRKLMILLRQKHEDPDSIEFEFASRANRCSLLLFFRSLTFVNDMMPNIPNSKNLAICAEEVAKNPGLFRNSPLLPLVSLPRFIEACTASIVEFMEDESMPCSDDYYWKLYDIISAYHIFQRIYLMHAEKGMESQLIFLSFHFTWLLKKLHNLYEGLCSMPPALAKCAEDTETLLKCNAPGQKLRKKCLKWFGSPPVFADDRAAEISRRAVELYETLDLVQRIKSPRIQLKDLKTIKTNMDLWFLKLSHVTFTSIYGNEFKPALLDVQDIRIQLCDTGVISTDDDDIMEVAVTPAKLPNISDSTLTVDLHLLPLWDYLFVIYEADLLSHACMLSEQNSEKNELALNSKLVEMFKCWGSQILGLNPVHLSHFIALQEFKSKKSLAPSLLYFLRHLRHGFSSDGLSALDFEILDNGAQIVPHINKWTEDYSWSKQQPLFTHIFSSSFGTTNSSLICQFPLGTYSERIQQLKKAQELVWKHFDKLANAKKNTFRYHSASIIVSWFNCLLSAVASLENLKSDVLNKKDILNLFDKLKITPLVTSKGNENILLLATDAVVELQAKLVDGYEDSNLQWTIGKAYILVGLLTYLVLMPRDYVDPGTKAKAKLAACKDTLHNIGMEIEMRRWVNEVTCGQSLYPDWVSEHPHVRSFKILAGEHQKKFEHMDKKVPFRANENSFFALKDKLAHYTEKLLSPDMVLDILSKLLIVNDYKEESQLEQNDPINIVQRALQYTSHLQNFADEILKEYALFPDLLVPFLVGIEQIIFGMSLTCYSVRIKEVVFPKQTLWNINEFLERFTQFTPNEWTTSLHVAPWVLSSAALKNFKLILSVCKDQFPNRGRLYYKFIKSAVLDIINEIKIQGCQLESKLSEMKELLFSAFQSYYKTWYIQDDIKKKKKAEEEKLFKIKRHEEEKSDEEKMDSALKEMFPLYEEEFSDIKDPETDVLKDNKKPNITAADDAEPISETDDCMPFTDEDMFEVCQLHATAIHMLSNSKSKQNKNLFIKNDQEVDIITPFLLRHEVISTITTTLANRLDANFEKNLIIDQLLLSQELLKLKGMEGDEYYDIYHDPNPSRVLTISSMLHKLVSRVKVLLQEFPENPNLMHILTVTNRVLSFPVSDPLMKFVVGLELILESTQVWEQNAHSKVSLKDEMEEITKKIIECRAMELDGWKKGLQNVIKKQYVKSSKWWFFMFPLFYTDNTYAESEKAVIVKGLQKCLEDSPIGEFPARLNILHTFLQEFQLQPGTKLSRSYANILFNVYTYYKQFLPAIENEISLIKKPIEKELKDYVKIARWNDINFYAVKKSVEKSHRTVLKHVKAFEEALLKPAKTSFILPSKNSLDDKENSWSLDIEKKHYICNVPKATTSFFKERSEAFFQKFPSYQKKVVKKSKEIAETFPVASYIHSLNDFCGNIIEALEEVTAEGPKSVLTRSREKKQTLLRIQNKKQMLSILCKNLKAIGLSYKLGMIKYKEDKATELMSVPAFDISKMKVLKHDNSFKELLYQSSCDTNHYFYKSLAQYAQLQRLMESPFKGLTLDIIHRIQGYSCHLLNLVSAQRFRVVKMSHDIDKFGCFLSTLSCVFEKREFAFKKNLTIIPPQEYFLEAKVDISNLLGLITITAGQFDALLDCAPESKFLTNQQHSPCLDERSLSGLIKNDAGWTAIKKAVNAFNCDIKNFLLELSDLNQSESIVSWDHFRSFTSLFSSVQFSMEKLIMQISEVCDPKCAMALNLLSLYNKVCDKNNYLNDEANKILESQMTQEKYENPANAVIVNLCQKLTTQVLLAIQDLNVLSTTVKEDSSDQNVVPDNLFTVKITNYLLEVEKCLRFKKISKLVKRLKFYVKRHEDTTEDLMSIDSSFRLLVHLAPLLNQYYQLTKVYLAVSLGMHRTSSKFLTILLDVFTILATKGFCIPPELEEEAAKDGGTKFEDTESGGLGEGEGSKDVSKDIQSEDQLDDAMKEGQEKEDDAPKDKDLKDEEDGIEMSDDIDGKLHSGDGAKDSDDEEDEDDNEGQDLDKQMGDVESEEAEKLDDKVWGSDSEDEGDLREDEGSGGMTENAPSELAAKDHRLEDDDREEGKEKGKKSEPQDAAMDETNEEYTGEKPDPMINAPPTQEPEIEELPENMEITEEIEKDDGGENLEEMNEVSETSDKVKEEEEETESGENEETEKDGMKGEEEAEGESEDKSHNITDQQETVESTDESNMETNESALPTQAPTEQEKALPSEMKMSSADPVISEENMDWENGAQNAEEQHKQGLSESKDMPSEDPGHEGKKSSGMRREAIEEKQRTQKMKLPGEKRTVDESTEEVNVKKRPILDRKDGKDSEANANEGESAEMYEHVSNEEKSTMLAMDIATKEQAEIRTAQFGDDDSESSESEEEVIELSSSDEDEKCNKAEGETTKAGQSQKSGSRDNTNKENADIPDGSIIMTKFVPRGNESSIHTQNELWKALSSKGLMSQKIGSESNSNLSAIVKTENLTDDELWRQHELSVSNLSQELCEQLRLVLEPTKMSKFKGDYRTGKRLNMRKIIPYIASQFRKDKIWLRRTKPSKRQYQIMLAMDDSSSMADNKSKKLAFDSLVVLGQSLTLLEAGELSVVSFGEKVTLLHGFNDQFSPNAGARILEQMTFSQKGTKIAQLLNFATETMIQARSSSHSSAPKETAQLLVIISDGRNIFSEGEKKVNAAVKEARDNNVFMVFLILDNPDGNHSILDIQSAYFEDKDMKMVPYMDKFPFPFYIILREITALPQVLGEALRQWFELVTSVDR